MALAFGTTTTARSPQPSVRLTPTLVASPTLVTTGLTVSPCTQRPPARLKWHQNLALTTRDERRLYQARRVMEHFSPVEAVESVHLSALGRPEKGPPKVYSEYVGVAGQAHKDSSVPTERSWGTHDDEPPPDLTERLRAFNDDSNTFRNLDTDPSQSSRTLLNWNKLTPGDNPPPPFKGAAIGDHGSQDVGLQGL